MRIKIWLALLLGITLGVVATLHAQERSAHVERIKIVKHESYDFRGIEFFDLRNSKTSTLLSGDADTELARFLSQHNGESAVLTIEVMER